SKNITACLLHSCAVSWGLTALPAHPGSFPLKGKLGVDGYRASQSTAADSWGELMAKVHAQ
ncbi:hypothetical protein V5799_024069, partial [Amblyomma americanum]